MPPKPFSRVRLVARFWQRVRRGPACWLWCGVLKDGYGQMKVSGRNVGAHRFSWEISRGPIPRGMNVLHRCDVPRCVNPAHLFVGTQADNVADMHAKGRARPASLPGERNGRAKLTVEEVVALKAAVAGGLTQRAAAEQWGISKAQVSRIYSGLRWKPTS